MKLLCWISGESATDATVFLAIQIHSTPEFKKKPLRSAKTIPPQVRHASCAGVMATKSSWSGTIAPEAKKVCCAVKLYLNARFMLGIAVSAS
jgi:hypothetical protein